MAATMSPIQFEMRDALRRLGLPEDGPATEAVTLMAITPWCSATTMMSGADNHLGRWV